MVNYPEIVCWRITSRCNRKCPFCFRPDRQELGTDEVLKIVDDLTNNGIKGMGITGGEPLLRDDIEKILEHIRGKGINICLATNCDFYKKHKEIIDQCVSTIGIPIEGLTEKIHDSLRGEGNFRNVIDAVEDIYRKSKLQMYFSTVLTESNIGDLSNIEKLLARYRDKIAYWKIYSIIGYSDRPFQSLKDNKISETKIREAISILGGGLGKDKIFYLSPEDRSEASLIINPDGKAVIPVNKKTKTKDFVLGDLLNDGAKSVFDNWSETADYGKYVCHKCALKCVKSVK